jgi:hypothetical protein
MSDSEREIDPKVHSRQSGDEYLAEQISDARRAMEATLDDLTLDLARAADLRRWVRRYPWAAVGTALVAGFTVGHWATKRRGQRQTAPADPVTSPIHSAAEPAASTQAKAFQTATPTPAWRAAAVTALFDLLRLIVTQLVTAACRSAASGAPPKMRPNPDTAPAPHANASPSSAPETGDSPADA